MQSFTRWVSWVLLVTLSGCVVNFRPVPRGMIGTEGVTIAAEDGSFQLSSSQPFTPPFYAKDCVVTATAENYRLALELGARPVKVTFPGREKPLFGLLSLCKVHPDATGPATRQYLIQVPESYVEATSAGRVSVVYEETNAGGQYDDGFNSYDAWQLWLSEIPFI